MKLIRSREDLPALSVSRLAPLALLVGLEGLPAVEMLTPTPGHEGLAVPLVAPAPAPRRSLMPTPVWIVGTANRLPRCS